MTNHLNDSPYKYDNPSDNIFTGIDWDSYEKNIEIFKKTNFFTDQFLAYYKTIAFIEFTQSLDGTSGTQ